MKKESSVFNPLVGVLQKYWEEFVYETANTEKYKIYFTKFFYMWKLFRESSDEFLKRAKDGFLEDVKDRPSEDIDKFLELLKVARGYPRNIKSVHLTTLMDLILKMGFDHSSRGGFYTVFMKVWTEYPSVRYFFPQKFITGVVDLGGGLEKVILSLYDINMKLLQRRILLSKKLSALFSIIRPKSFFNFLKDFPNTLSVMKQDLRTFKYLQEGDQSAWEEMIQGIILQKKHESIFDEGMISQGKAGVRKKYKMLLRAIQDGIQINKILEKLGYSNEGLVDIFFKSAPVDKINASFLKDNAVDLLRLIDLFMRNHEIYLGFYQ